MGVSEDVTVDSTVGTIVWVRRRNGSWWPGRILGQEELSATHLMSPRSGTPVKLLGREDASVDWYNLEKSKRVKAFRCGEFNECIKKAEAAQGGPAKKREKYARREDAILHALELEKEQLAGKQLKTAVVSTSLNDKRPSTVKDELEHSSHIESVSRGDGMKGTSRYASTKSSSRKPHSALKDDFKYGSSTSRKGRQPIQESGDEDNGEIIPRMRGLQDFGLKSASSKRKQSIPMGFESSQRNPADGSLMYDCPSVRGIDSLSQLSISPNCNGMKRKKFHSGAGEELNVKRRDRRRPLVQVLQNTAKLSDYKASHAENGILPISLQGERGHATHMGSSQGRNSLSSPYDGDVNGYLGHAHRRHSVFGPDSSLLYNDRLAEERVDDEGDSGSSPESEEANELLPVPGAGNVGRNARYGSPLPGVKWDRQNPNSEEFDNDSPTYESLVHHLEQGGADGPDGVSKWQLKRKRNIRNLSRKHLDMPEGGDGDFSEDRLTHSSGVGFRHKRDRGLQSSYYHGDALDEMDPDGNTKLAVLRHSSLGIPFREQQRYGDNDSESDDDPRFVSPSSYEGRHHRNFSSALKSRAWLAEEPLGYWVESDDYLGPPRFYPPEAEPLYDEQGSMLDSMLFDVDLKVNASYQGEHVPLVSLMSRLNGKAIIGHPVPVEVMEDGYSEFLLREAAAFQDCSTAKDDNSTLPPVWRTGRRTAMQRVPRPKSLPQENENITQYSSPDMKPPSKRSDAGNANDKKNKKGIQAYKKHLEKSNKKSSLSNQKTRTLSSFAADGKHNNIDASREGFSKVVDPVVKCIPVTAVFDRLRESLGISQGAAISVKETATVVPKEGDKIT